MEPLFLLVVIVLTLTMTSGDDNSCEIRPVFNTKERSAEFFAKPSWSGAGGLSYDEESVFVRRRHCPVRVRVDEEADKTPPGGNGSHDKEAITKKSGHRKLKGSKRKRKKEKRKRFRKKKKKN